MPFSPVIERMLLEIIETVKNDGSIDAIDFGYFPWHGNAELSLRSVHDHICDNPADWKRYNVLQTKGNELADEIADEIPPLRGSAHAQAILSAIEPSLARGTSASPAPPHRSYRAGSAPGRCRSDGNQCLGP